MEECKKGESGKNFRLNCTVLETLDPNPDIHGLFLEFDSAFFDSTLRACEVKWSKRMTLCAGLCQYVTREGFCSIRLSQPLLQYRPRSDLVNTLLHEMIHAYLFITKNNRDRDGHGQEFQFHMNRINAIANTSITIYHTFNDEVMAHRKHWWRCEGKCRNDAPYFGWVKRAINRAPNPADPWFAKHLSQCGGEFVKVKEPEKKTQKQKRERESKKTQEMPQKSQKTIDCFFPTQTMGDTKAAIPGIFLFFILTRERKTHYHWLA